MQISKGKVAIIDYVLKGDNGEVLDASKNGDFAYLHGADNIISGLEDALEGKQVGDELQVRVEPKDGYGARDPDRVQVVPRDMFEADDEIEAGIEFHAESPEGRMMIVKVTAVDGDEITIDGNHAMAGIDLHFNVSVIDVRDATEEEIEHGHVHATDGCGH